MSYINYKVVYGFLPSLDMLPEEEREGNPHCGTLSPDKVWICTRKIHHDGDHVANNGELYARWEKNK